MDTKRLRRFAGRYLARQKIRAKDKEMTAWIVKEQKVLIDHLIDEGVDKVSLAHGITIFTKSLIWGKYDDKQKAIQAMLDCSDTRELVTETFDARTLASFLRELNKENKELPESFKGVITAEPSNSLIAKKV